MAWSLAGGHAWLSRASTRGQAMHTCIHIAHGWAYTRRMEERWMQDGWYCDACTASAERKVSSISLNVTIVMTLRELEAQVTATREERMRFKDARRNGWGREGIPPEKKISTSEVITIVSTYAHVWHACMRMHMCLEHVYACSRYVRACIYACGVCGCTCMHVDMSRRCACRRQQSESAPAACAHTHMSGMHAHVSYACICMYMHALGM